MNAKFYMNLYLKMAKKGWHVTLHPTLKILLVTPVCFRLLQVNTNVFTAIIFLFIILRIIIPTIDEKDHLIPPNNPILIDFALRVYDIIDLHYEHVPENIQLKEFLNISHNTDSYYEVRYVLGWLYLHSYLFHYNGDILHDRQMKIVDELGDKFKGENIPTLVENVQDHFILDDTCPLLAYRASTWLALILGEKHPFIRHSLANWIC